MPFFNFLRQSAIVQTPRTMQLSGLFELPPAQQSECKWSVNLPIEEKPWQVGLIVGPSGSGKSTLASEAFGTQLVTGYDWPDDKAIVDGFPSGMGIKDITGALSSVGFSSPPSWLRPFRVLSTGEQFRATMARALCEPPGVVVIDEFTSTVDRQVAQVASVAVSKAVRSDPKRQFVAVSCHYDILEWLQPDWVVEMPDGIFHWRVLRRRPSVNIEIARVHRSAWELFNRHHYLSHDIHKAAACYVGFVGETPAVFTAVLPFPHPTHPGWREHRTVCRPDYQGIGVGNAMSEFVASVYACRGLYGSTTGNPAMIHHRAKSPLWDMRQGPGLGRKHSARNKSTIMKNTGSTNRLTATFRYVGPVNRSAAIGFGVISASQNP